MGHPTSRHYTDKKFNRDRGRREALIRALGNCDRVKEPLRYKALKALVG